MLSRTVQDFKNYVTDSTLGLITAQKFETSSLSWYCSRVLFKSALYEYHNSDIIHARNEWMNEDAQTLHAVFLYDHLLAAQTLSLSEMVTRGSF